MQEDDDTENAKYLYRWAKHQSGCWMGGMWESHSETQVAEQRTNECCCHSNSGLQWNANDSKRVTYDYPLMDHSLLSYHHANVHLKCITNHHPGSISEVTKTILSGSDWGVGGCHNNSLEWSNSNQRPNDWTRQEYCIFISELNRLLLHPCVKRPAADTLQGYTNNSLKFKQGAWIAVHFKVK